MHKSEEKNRARRMPRVLIPLSLCLLSGSAGAQPESSLLEAPSPLRGRINGVVQPQDGRKLKAAPGVPQRESRELHYNLGIRYTEGRIYNPSTGQEDKVRLRSYVDLDQGATLPSRFIAPLIRMKPGQTVRMTLVNQLPQETDCEQQDINTPKCFNVTNMHSHGLWISPAGNSDNVLLKILPATSFQYEYNVPEDHPAGTFWYHPHVHGSTAVQVASGMAGALIIQGDRLPIFRDGKLDKPGDIDTLLRPFEPGAPGQGNYPDVLLFQQISYACFTSTADGKKQLVQDAKKRWICEEGQTGEVEDFTQQFGLGKWQPSGRRTSINGMVAPFLHMKSKTLYRWRLVDAGVHEAINLRMARVTTGKEPSRRMSIEEEQQFVLDHCKEPVPQWEIAADGLTRGQMVKRDINRLQPGYRSDILFAFPEPGTYCLYDDQSPADSSPTRMDENQRLLGFVRVSGERITEGVEAFVSKKLLEAADRYTDATVRNQVKAGLRDGLKTASFAWHKNIDKSELKGTPRTVEFYAGKKKDKAGNEKVVFEINDAPFSHEFLPERQLALNDVEEWTLTSKAGSHPFHIHVNPFQIVSIEDKATGKEVDPDKDPKYADYAGMKGTWKDTILVKDDVRVRVRTRYERYIGDFVLHCHILDHEDQGMMQMVRIGQSDGKGGIMDPYQHGTPAKSMSHSGHH